MKNPLTLLALLMAYGVAVVAAGLASQKPPLTAAATEAVKLADILHPDGTVKRGTHGSFDARGYRLETAPNGEPRFVPQTVASENENWDAGFHLPGVNGVVQAIAVNGNEVYVGGRFTTAGEVKVGHIARWNGSAWSNLGGGVNGQVRALAVRSGSVYVGGDFTTAGGISANHIARWNGSEWAALGSGVNNSVGALAVSADGVFVGGGFTVAGGITANGIAHWNGTAWSALGSGVNGGVAAIVISGNAVYVGGSFTIAGGINARSIARWDGASWSALGSGVNNSVFALAFSGTNLLVGGDFTTAGEGGLRGIAQWNGTTWSSFSGGGLGAFFDRPVVYAIGVRGAEVYLGGDFDGVAGSRGNVNNIARWNGSEWTVLGTQENRGVDGRVNALSVNAGNVYAGGAFSAAGGAGASRVACWNGEVWSALGTGNGLSDRVLALNMSGANLYAGGLFTAAGRSAALGRLARWTGSEWVGFPGRVTSFGYNVSSLAVRDNEVYAGTNADPGLPGRTFAHVDRWVELTPTQLGSRFGDQINAVAILGSDIYVGGEFNTSTGDINYIARWNGTEWVALGSGISGEVHALVVSGGELYVGGSFTTANGANNIAKWNGTTWTALGAGVNGEVRAIAVNGNDVYVGGRFTTAGEVSANNIAKWNGSSWSALGSGVNNFVLALAVTGNDVFAGGNFTMAGGINVRSIARWTGTFWAPLGDGVDGGVNALVISGNTLYVGGEFLTAGDKISANVGRYRITPLTNTAPIVESLTATQSQGSIRTGLFSLVRDQESPNSELRVRTGAVSPGLTVENLRIVGQQLDANISVACNATGTLVAEIIVTDPGGLEGTGTITILVTPNTPPVLSYNRSQTVSAGGALTINPVSGPRDNGSLRSLTVQSISPASFTGTVAVNPATGVVNIENAGPAGNFTMTIAATDNCGATTAASFTLAVTPSPPPTCGNYNFTNLTSYDTAANPHAVATGDFNGDGRLDLVTANYEANNLSVLLNDGVGGFNAARHFAAGSNPRFVAVGDVNADRHLDLIVANYTGFDLSVLLGDGRGNFTAATNVGGMGYPTSIALGDFNGDAKPDLAVTNSGFYVTTIVYGNGDGTFANPTPLYFGSFPLSVTVADFNKDGKDDLAVANSASNNATVFTNNGEGTFTPVALPSGIAPIAMAAGDFNGDGFPDLTVANYDSNNVTVLLNNAVGGFRAPLLLPAGVFPVALTAADVNGDRLADVLVANEGSGFVTLLLAQQTTTGVEFVRTEVTAREGLRSLVVGDFNGDGKGDLTATEYWANRIITMAGVCGVSPPPPPPPPPSSLTRPTDQP